ncbi:MAG: sn-glycerol-3-phosphate ABC transporter ATP-binding protein UgpC [Burkholderiales bacterium]|uniref:sn-glycerol-3-phosphate ABC transporter ATP-binding protein UgpC n=1 Tax=Janthinobacterium tructae TaxID=2590869 RepID=A0A4Y6RL54_9BURK|nr:sn-glycerol-3-phosphate ABC transporter ATP-binding protein UgpC [Janthinobacterium tructae]MBH1984481.1 sn-glycerol-3-phosphate ABC transporter ATP-binding protein UgpC [Burkholderiales bacterium]MBH1997141.1 sn-glycerol-3-phosphate ABC transporter ATP-binding protein UgpC [Burkholderiales bacterium]MBH2068779.1 sn-glycerol-3-phosphate ABC transporter ATP-binding protein UgpC [Burkholderiales bacterium]QDG73184.1 sn-glycerol-3-phosphate ABC transporter ATP-binding protein UgpC [Janthinobact
MAHIVLKNIVKLYDDKHPVIHGIDLAIGDGEFVVFVGPSGCGKSTLLRMIAGLEDITDGELHIGGKLANDIAPAERGLAMVFQSYALYPHMTVYENMAFALSLAGHKKAEVRAAVERAAEILQITPLLKRKPKDLSGGQRQRVAIGRAIVRKPKVFLFDEPLSNLDASLRVQMRVEISRLHQELKTTMIYVTHDQVEAMTLGERIVVFNGGRIEQVGSPHELYNHPGNLFVAGFLGAPKMNFIACEAVACGPGTVAVRLPGGAVIDVEAQGNGVAPGDQLTLGVRAEHVSLQHGETANDNVIDASVSHVEYLGDVAIVYASMPGVAGMLAEMLAVKLPAEDGVRRAGDAMRLHLPPQRCLLFDAAGQALARTFAAPAQPFM